MVSRAVQAVIDMSPKRKQFYAEGLGYKDVETWQRNQIELVKLYEVFVENPTRENWYAYVDFHDHKHMPSDIAQICHEEAKERTK